MDKLIVGILMGSDSDFETMKSAVEILREFDVPFEVEVTSAHRSPERTRKYVSSARERGVRVIIVGAGGAAHLGGVVAAETTLPVIGVPIDSSPLRGFDALLSTAQMPGGVPVATMAIGEAGAKNAGLFAVQILALSDARMAEKLLKYKAGLAESVEEKSRKLQASLRKTQ